MLQRPRTRAPVVVAHHAVAAATARPRPAAFRVRAATASHPFGDVAHHDRFVDWLLIVAGASGLLAAFALHRARRGIE